MCVHIYTHTYVHKNISIPTCQEEARCRAESPWNLNFLQKLVATQYPSDGEASLGLFPSSPNCSYVRSIWRYMSTCWDGFFSHFSLGWIEVLSL